MDSKQILVNWRDDAFRCDSSLCDKTCCTSPTLERGIPVNLNDLLRLRDAGLSHRVEGHFMSRARARELVTAGIPLHELRQAEFPHVAMQDGRCVHFEPHSKRCTAHEARPRLCRSFPYETSGEGDMFRATYSICCSLVETYGYNARTTPPDARRLPQVHEGPYAYTWRKALLEDLAEHDRQGVEQCLKREREERGTAYVLAHHIELVAELKLDDFLHPDDRDSVATARGVNW